MKLFTHLSLYTAFSAKFQDCFCRLRNNLQKEGEVKRNNNIIVLVMEETYKEWLKSTNIYSLQSLLIPAEH